MVSAAQLPRTNCKCSEIPAHPREALCHSLLQVVQFSCARPHDPATLPRALNANLPADVRVHRAYSAPPAFNVRFSLGKVYLYDVHTGGVADPFTTRFRHHPRHPERMQLGAMR